MASDPFSLVQPRTWDAAQVATLVRALCRFAGGDDARPGLKGIRIEQGAAFATDGWRMLGVMGLASEALNGQTIAVEDRRILPVTVRDKWPVNWEAVKLSDPKRHTYQYEVRDFLRLRKKRHDHPVSIVKGELAIGSNKDALRVFNLRFLAELPPTDDSLILSFNTIDVEEPIIIRPRDGGWFGVIMGQRATGKSTLA